MGAYAELAANHSTILMQGEDDVFLRLARVGDEAELAALAADSYDLANRYEYIWNSPEEVPEWAYHQVRAAVRDIDDGTLLQYRIMQPSMAGTVSVHGYDEEHGDAMLGYGLGRQYLGRGLATRAAESLLALAIDRWDLERVRLSIHPDNVASIAVAKRLGAERTAEIDMVHTGKGYAEHTLWEIRYD